MFSKTNLVSTLATAVWGYLGGWVLWGMITDPMLVDHNSAGNIMKEIPDMFYLILGCILVGFFFSYIYSKFAGDSYGIGTGVNFGILVGLLVGLGEGLINMAVMNMLDFTGTIINAITYAVFYAAMGAVAGIVYQKVG